MKNWIVLAFVAPFLFAATGCPNAFVESANKKSDDALLFSAEQHANASQWTAAITDIAGMSASGKAKRETKAALASYYGGRCGLNLLNLADTLQNHMGASNLWPTLMSAEIGATTAALNDCVLGEQSLLSIDPVAANRTPDENVLLAFIEFAKMGAALEQSNADANHDGTLDGTFNPCLAADITDAATQQLATGLTIGLQALNASGAAVGGTATSGVNTMCANVDARLGTTGFCSNTSTAFFTGPALDAVRALIKSNEVGFNSCGGSVGSSGACSCP
jgi:hypothetical protein